MFVESGAFIFGRRTYEIANGWGGSHPVNGAPIFVLTHEPPADYPRGPSNLRADELTVKTPRVAFLGRASHTLLLRRSALQRLPIWLR
jgi:dihydrofolate reductase